MAGLKLQDLSKLRAKGLAGAANRQFQQRLDVLGRDDFFPEVCDGVLLADPGPQIVDHPQALNDYR